MVSLSLHFIAQDDSVANAQQIIQIEQSLVDALAGDTMPWSKYCQSAYELIRSLWDQESINFQEQYMALFLNPVGKTIGYRVICTGTMLSTPVDIRLIAGLALNTFAVSVILAHNHPSGRLEASKTDISTTKKVKKALKLFDIKLLDHLIISDSGYLSMALKGLL